MGASLSWDTERTRAGKRRVTAGLGQPSLADRFTSGEGLAPAPGSVFDEPFAGEDVPPLSGAHPVGARLEPGDRLPGTRYVVVRRLGQGGMGEIYEGEHVELGRRAALKVLHHHHRGRPDLVARLREEARILGRLRHPNLVEVFDLGVTSDQRPWFAMPLLRGRDLRDELRCRGPLSAPEVADLAAQALDGLAAAHAAGFVHRDVKLENLFLEEDGTLKVLDFGIAKVVAEGAARRTAPGGMPGTPRSMAPEQCVGGAVDGRADLYAMGLVLYELCVGRGPFDDVRGNDHGLRFAHCQRKPPAPAALSAWPIPAALEAVILRALAKSPSDRFQTATEMADAVRRSLDPAPGEGFEVALESALAPAVGRQRRSLGRSRRSRRRGNPWIAATFATLAIACLALGLALGRAVPTAPASPPGVATPR